MKGILVTIIVVAITLLGCKDMKMLEIERIHSVGINGLSSKGVELEFDMDVYNPNKLKVKIKDYDLDLFINNVRIGKAVIDDKMVFNSKDTTKQHLSVKSEFKGMALGLLPLLKTLKKGNKATFRVAGNLKAGALGIYRDVDVEFQREIALRN